MEGYVTIRAFKDNNEKFVYSTIEPSSFGEILDDLDFLKSFLTSQDIEMIKLYKDPDDPNSGENDKIEKIPKQDPFKIYSIMEQILIKYRELHLKDSSKLIDIGFKRDSLSELMGIIRHAYNQRMEITLTQAFI